MAKNILLHENMTTNENMCMKVCHCPFGVGFGAKHAFAWVFVCVMVCFFGFFMCCVVECSFLNACKYCRFKINPFL